jgi:hypothetical protein
MITNILILSIPTQRDVLFQKNVLSTKVGTKPRVATMQHGQLARKI